MWKFPFSHSIIFPFFSYPLRPIQLLSSCFHLIAPESLHNVTEQTAANTFYNMNVPREAFGYVWSFAIECHMWYIYLFPFMKVVHVWDTVAGDHVHTLLLNTGVWMMKTIKIYKTYICDITITLCIIKMHSLQNIYIYSQPHYKLVWLTTCIYQIFKISSLVFYIKMTFWLQFLAIF